MTENIMAVLLVVNLALMASSRLAGCIGLVALQGIAIGLLPLFAPGGFSARGFLLAAFVAVLKGIVFPRLLHNAIRGASVRREVEPFVGYGFSLIIGVALTILSFWLGTGLLPSSHGNERIVLAGAIATVFTGLFLIVSRRKALTQVLGYLVMENGIAAFGLAVVSEIPLLIELGILLDAFVAIFVMAIIIYHISREFDHIDADQLSTLKG
ncbi:MAG: NADH-quinone oxidoreductase subunit K [Kiritimatiellia bacterium]